MGEVTCLAAGLDDVLDRKLVHENAQISEPATTRRKHMAVISRVVLGLHVISCLELGSYGGSRVHRGTHTLQ